MKLKEISYTKYIENGKGSFTAKAALYPDEDPKRARDMLRDFVNESIKALE